MRFPWSGHPVVVTNAAKAGLVLQGVGPGVASWLTPTGGGGGGAVTEPYDDPSQWTADLGYDYEFGATGTSLPSGYSTFGSALSSYTEGFGAGTLAHPGAGGDDWRGIDRAIPSESAWEATVKVALAGDLGSNWVQGGLVLRRTATGQMVTVQFQFPNGHVEVDKWNSPTSYNSTQGSVGSGAMAQPGYLKLRKNSATSWDGGFSFDGESWFYPVTAWDLTAFLGGAPDRLGFGLNVSNGKPGQLAVHWVRVR